MVTASLLLDKLLSYITLDISTALGLSFILNFSIILAREAAIYGSTILRSTIILAFSKVVLYFLAISSKLFFSISSIGVLLY